MATSPHKQVRALDTRKLLVAAARTVFSRDGYEQARIEDIAKLAGRTRGAFYANFKDKEDAFFAIFEENLAYDHSQLRPRLRKVRTTRARLDILVEYLVELCKDRQRTLLNLEFKSYAIRHPRKQKRLVALHASMLVRASLPELDEVFPRVAKQSIGKRRADMMTISAVIDGLAISRLFDPGTMKEAQLARYLQLCVSQVFE